ncbi:unnamed protein product [[Actinomadura] parvosata subsp. kistnae]|uniref:DUF3224 domain-containing protein n=1 Tax=[Actinomadura] parvosata subsp. kistnae TaxID=1909395 RepID=A0A1V0AHY3_9ACTN|nr:DUF3224 domain-containing protein [Nonomuraea sp. ATCC 55076]AQZ69816.1 hypothetical protein BKM31_57635 [Nonomuraea sp. ATCC 55076]SPL90110.1 unnamed protein product [Actinomadura parvosata subsp. kistnae]
MTAKGTFETAGWTPQPPYDERDGITLGVVTLTKTFSGDLTGTSLVTMLVASTPVEESRSYVALERIEGTLHGRAGSFVVQHDATSDNGAQTLRIRVVADSGTGELRGLRGEMGIAIDPDGGHSYTFDYTL